MYQKILSILFFSFVQVTLFSVITGCSGSSTDTSTQNSGKFAITMLSKTSNSSTKSVVNLQGDSINASNISYFILKNVGGLNITDIHLKAFNLSVEGTENILQNADNNTSDESGNSLSIFKWSSDNKIVDFTDSTQYFVPSSSFICSPDTLDSLSPESNSSVVQLIGIKIMHGTTSQIGMTGVVQPISLSDNSANTKHTFIAIYGTDTAGNTVCLVIDLKNTIYIADWTIYNEDGNEVSPQVGTYDGSAYFYPTQVRSDYDFYNSSDDYGPGIYPLIPRNQIYTLKNTGNVKLDLTLPTFNGGISDVGIPYTFEVIGYPLPSVQNEIVSISKTLLPGEEVSFIPNQFSATVYIKTNNTIWDINHVGTCIKNDMSKSTSSDLQSGTAQIFMYSSKQ